MYSIIGANGYLGSYMKKVILEDTNEGLICVDLNIPETEKEDRVRWVRCDITDRRIVDSVLEELSKYENLKIIYLAAYHNPDLVEQNKQLAWNINVTSLSYFINQADFAKEIYYPSTDSVYGESVDFYHFKEGDPLNPVNVYGHNKCAAEAILVHKGRNVVRFPFLISPSLAGKPHFYDRIVESLRNDQPFEMYEDSYRSSLSFENAARLTVTLIEKENRHPIVNVCGDKDLSKYDVGLMIAEREGFSKDLIVPINMGEIVVEGFVTKRATSTLMDNALLKQILDLDYVDIFERPKL
ncbi:MAG: sugar nucleotide-binding protein [Erysipelotrichaceae bacterium]|nr:sugar nucleotide-binding protein [Erysipelotrichaceae bacterium]